MTNVVNFAIGWHSKEDVKLCVTGMTVTYSACWLNFCSFLVLVSITPFTPKLKHG